jgi:replicative DNA helicase
VSDFLAPNHFFSPEHRKLYEVMSTLISSGKLAKPETIKPFLSTDFTVGGLDIMKYAMVLGAEASPTVNMREYGRVIYEAALRRQVMDFGENIIKQCRRGDLDFEPAKYLDDIRREIDDIAAKERIARKSDSKPLIKSSAAFISDFVPPDYVVVGLLQRRFVYSFTGMTGSGKTSVALRLVASVALGVPFAGRDTKPVRVLYAAAENPDDVDPPSPK